MELTFVVAVNDIWQLQPSWLHPCKVYDQGRSVGNMGWVSSPSPEFLFPQKSWKC